MTDNLTCSSGRPTSWRDRTLQFRPPVEHLTADSTALACSRILAPLIHSRNHGLVARSSRQKSPSSLDQSPLTTIGPQTAAGLRRGRKWRPSSTATRSDPRDADDPPVFGCGHAHVRAAVLDGPRSIAQGSLVQYHRVLLDHLEVYDRRVLEIVRNDAVCRRLMTTPGVSRVVALSYRTAMDTPARFAKVVHPSAPTSADAETLRPDFSDDFPDWRDHRRAVGVARPSTPFEATVRARPPRRRCCRRRGTGQSEAEHNADPRFTEDCWRAQGSAEYWSSADRKMLWCRRHRQTNSVRVCSPASRRFASLRPRYAGLPALTPAPRTLVQTGSC